MHLNKAFFGLSLRLQFILPQKATKILNSAKNPENSNATKLGYKLTIVFLKIKTSATYRFISMVESFFVTFVRGLVK